MSLFDQVPVGTPVYVYSAATLTRHFLMFRQALDWTDHLICFAVKANSNLAVLKNGRAKAVRFSTLGALCDVLDCQPGDLMRWEDDVAS